jgi:hypothetical protein
MVRGLVDLIRPVVRSHSLATVVSALLRVMLAVADFQHGLGAFEAALETHHEAFTAAEEVGAKTREFKTIHIEMLAYHTHSLVDSDACEEASAHLQEAKVVWENDMEPSAQDLYGYTWPRLLGLFTVVHAHSHTVYDALSDIEEVIDVTRNQMCHWLRYMTDFIGRK